MILLITFFKIFFQFLEQSGDEDSTQHAEMCGVVGNL